MQNCVFLYLVPLLQYPIGNLLAYGAWLLVASLGKFKHPLVREAQCCKVADANPTIAEFLLIRGLFQLFLISLARAAFWSCFR